MIMSIFLKNNLIKVIKHKFQKVNMFNLNRIISIWSSFVRKYFSNIYHIPTIN